MTETTRVPNLADSREDQSGHAPAATIVMHVEASIQVHITEAATGKGTGCQRSTSRDMNELLKRSLEHRYNQTEMGNQARAVRKNKVQEMIYINSFGPCELPL